MKEYYAIGPYQLGSKTRKSWVVGIPAEVVTELQINGSTIFALSMQEDSGSIMLRKINEIIEMSDIKKICSDKSTARDSSVNET